MFQSIFDGIFGILSKLIGLVFDWPFLLFAFLVWMATRFRDQIGSILDRRGAIPAEELSSRIRQELESVSREVAALSGELADLQQQMSKMENTVSRSTGDAVLDPIRTKLNSIDARTAGIRSDLNEVSRDEQKSREVIEANRKQVEQIASLTAALKDETAKNHQETLSASAPKEAVEAVQARVDSVESGIREIGAQVAEIRTAAENAVSRDSLELLKAELKPTLVEIDGLKSAIKDFQSRLESEPWNEAAAMLTTRIEPIRADLDKMSETIDEMRRETGGMVPRDVTDRLDEGLGAVSREISTIKESFLSLAGRIENQPDALPEELNKDIERLNQEIGHVKSSVQRLENANQAAGGKAKKKTKAPARPNQ
jgi:predicted  nucleic acid-binding Zn-ribbon protein